MGTKLSVSRKGFFGCTTAQPQMAEANTSVSDSENPSTANGCDCRDSVTKSKASKKSFSLSCKKKSKFQEEHDGTKSRSDKNKSRSGWSLRWRMKSPRSAVEDEASSSAESVREPMINLERFNPEDYPIEDRDELARLERAREIAEGIEMEIDSLPSFYRGQQVETSNTTEASIEEAVEAAGVTGDAGPAERGAILFDGLTVLLHRSLAISIDSQRAWNVLSQLDLHFLAQHYNWHQHQQGPQGMFTLTPRTAQPAEPTLSSGSSTYSEETPQQLAHTQVDYLHCLVPDLLDITKCSFYWGKMDRYEAERLLENKPDGTFLLRDSAQEEYLFSVSFRRYNRSLHARIEQWNHLFSFDSHDPGVFSSPTILGLIDHYKNPELCMFFEPTLTLPLHRNIPFSLQHLCRAVVCNTITYDGISSLALPKPLKLFLKEYHYKQRIRVRRLDL